MSALAVVTGAGTGLGRACASRLAARGLGAVCVARRIELLQETVDEIAHAGGGAEAVAADISSGAGVAAVRDAVGERPVAALVHSAARESVVSFRDCTPEEFDAVMATNVKGPYFLTQALAPRFTEGAGVVFVSSMAAAVAMPRHSAYGTSKAALVGMTKHLAVELAPAVRVNCVCPGGMNTPMAQEFLAAFLGDPPSDDAMQQLMADGSRVLLGGIADPADVAKTVVHVACDATAMTGSVVTVDLGYSAR